MMEMDHTKMMEQANKIAELCLSFYSDLPKAKRSLKDTEWTIYSALVMESKNDTFEVVSCGTGTKCIGSMMLSEKGDILNDSHAEVVCRRAFIRFLMSQIRASKSSSSESIFKYDDKTKKFKIDKDVRFHMFTTSSPCGDASIYSINDNQDDDGYEPDTKKPKLLSEGFTGAKLLFFEDVEDVMAQTEGKIRIKPGKGDRTMSLSCSDKIARWNLLGIQGCMLSSILEAPIYLTSVILADGTSYNQVAMERALFKRFNDADKFLNHPFKLHRPIITVANNKIKFPFAKNDSVRVNPSANSVVYCRVDEKEKSIEVGVSGKRQGVTKKQLQTRKAHLRISKVELFTDYVNILRDSPDVALHLYPSFSSNLDNLCYKDVKTLSSNDYFAQWKMLKETFLPNWTTKNGNLSDFKSL